MLFNHGMIIAFGFGKSYHLLFYEKHIPKKSIMNMNGLTFKGEVHSENYFFFYWLKLFSSALRDEQKKPREKILIFGEVMNV